jgi:putative endonuclease
MGVKEKSFYWIYMLRLANGSYYTGYAKDLKMRYRAHCSGRGAKLTRSFPPVSIVGCWKLFSGKGTAMQVEAWIKGCSRRMKQTLIDDPQKLQDFLEQPGTEGGRGKGKVLILPQDPDTIERETNTSAVDPIDHF